MKYKIAVIIPAFKCKKHILDVINKIGDEVEVIYVVDDACPERTGAYVLENCTDSRVRILKHEKNQGVGGAVITGYQAALGDGCDVIVKLDGDGQMDPQLIKFFVAPLLAGRADYTKGNRFSSLEGIRKMPMVRVLGNAGLSFLTKMSTGYWSVFDPTNGFTAIHVEALKKIPLAKLSRRYFFESDILFRLGNAKAVVQDIHMVARYEDEVSNLKVNKVIFEFSYNHLKNLFKRIIYNYFVLNFTMASIELVFGIILFVFGLVYGSYNWIYSYKMQIASPTGTVVLSAITVILGTQMLLSFLHQDIACEPKIPLQEEANSVSKFLIFKSEDSL